MRHHRQPADADDPARAIAERARPASKGERGRPSKPLEDVGRRLEQRALAEARPTDLSIMTAALAPARASIADEPAALGELVKQRARRRSQRRR